MQYIVAVDSDGTAFDSMGHKHIDAFIPAALAVWQMPDEVKQHFIELEKYVNLFSALRGINRFPGLLTVFEMLLHDCPQAKENLPELAPLREYIQAESVYSTKTLREWTAAHPSSALNQVLIWSELADMLFTKACEGLKPFPGVTESLRDASMTANVVVVSAAMKEGLRNDWAAGGLLQYVSCLMGQEDGSKAEQLHKAIASFGTDVRTIMLGDTPGDAQAANSVGAAFYPIIPGEEVESWELFHREILMRFLSDTYDAEERRSHLTRMEIALHVGD